MSGDISGVIVVGALIVGAAVLALMTYQLWRAAGANRRSRHD